MNAAQLPHEHILDVSEGDGEINTLATASEGHMCNRAADLLKNVFIIKKVRLKGLDAVVEIAQRLKFLLPLFSGTLGTDA